MSAIECQTVTSVIGTSVIECQTVTSAIGSQTKVELRWREYVTILLT